MMGYAIPVGGRLERTSDTVLSWSPVASNSIPIFNGTSWVVVTPSSTPTLANNANDLDAAALTYDANYDIYAQYSSATAFTLVAKKWSNATTRAVTPTLLDGILTYDGSTDGKKRRYLGVIRLRNDTGAKFTDQIDKQFILNHYNRRRKPFGKSSPYAGSAINAVSTTWRRLQNDATWILEALFDGTNTFDIDVNLYLGSGVTYGSVAFAIDATDTRAPGCPVARGGASHSARCRYAAAPALGYHYIYPISRANTGNEEIDNWVTTADETETGITGWWEG